MEVKVIHPKGKTQPNRIIRSSQACIGHLATRERDCCRRGQGSGAQADGVPSDAYREAHGRHEASRVCYMPSIEILFQKYPVKLFLMVKGDRNYKLQPISLSKPSHLFCTEKGSLKSDYLSLFS